MARAQRHTAAWCGFDSRPLHNMYEQNEKEIEQALAEIITAQPHEINIGRKTLHLYPVTFAKTFVLRRWMDALEIDTALLKASPNMECLRLAESKPDIVAHILAIHTAANTRKALHDKQGMATRRNLLLGLKREHLAGLLKTALTQDNTELLMQHLGISSERDRLQKVLEVKRKTSKNNLTFGGKSIFGTFIGQLKEMGYSDEEIIFERGYSYLRLMLADKVTSLYLSDDELESLSQSDGGTLLDGEDDASLDVLEAMIKQGGERKPIA